MNPCEEAIKIVQQRGQNYNHPRPNFEATAHALNCALYYKLAQPITAEDVPNIMIAVKLARESYKHTDDNLIDICGYAQTAAMLRPDETAIVRSDWCIDCAADNGSPVVCGPHCNREPGQPQTQPTGWKTLEKP